MIRVMLVDDHALVRMGFRMLLADAQVEVVAECGDGETACSSYPQVKPDVVVMDLSMPGMGGLEAVRRILAQDPKARILVLSAHEDTAHPRRVLKRRRPGLPGQAQRTGRPDRRGDRRGSRGKALCGRPDRPGPGHGPGARCETNPGRPCSANASSRSSCNWRKRPERGPDRREPEPFAQHGGHPPLPRQAEAQREQPVGADAGGAALGPDPGMSRAAVGRRGRFRRRRLPCPACARSPRRGGAACRRRPSPAW